MMHQMFQSLKSLKIRITVTSEFNLMVCIFTTYTYRGSPIEWYTD